MTDDEMIALACYVRGADLPKNFWKEVEKKAEKGNTAALVCLGNRDSEKGFDKNLHTSDFNFDETVLLKGLEASLKFINYSKKY